MEIPSHLILMVLLIFVGGSDTFFDFDPAFGIDTPWNDNTFHRNIIESCECGQHTTKANGSQPWNVFLHIQTDPTSSNSTKCIGTLITTNLIATSHKCFLHPGKHFNIYDLWKPKGGVANAVWEASSVTVSTMVDPSVGHRFEVEQIIYNPIYAVTAATKAFPPQFDLALVKIKGLNPTSSLHPICLPSYSRARDLWNGRELENADAYYYGYHEKTRDNPTKILGMIKSEEDQECSARLKNKKYEMKYNFCFEYNLEIAQDSPSVAGGPLYVDIAGTNTSYLIGIASVVDSKTRAGSGSPPDRDFHFFTNLFPLIKYIEYMADQHKSSWCKPSGEFSFHKKPRENLRRGDATSRALYPWEMEGTSTERDESLDCVCGIPNKAIGGRVVGGVTAIPHEFSWMSYLKLYLFGRGGKFWQCGGTVINDRMILSAAHCIITKNRLNRADGKAAIDAENVDVSFKLHSKHGDDEEMKGKVREIVYHPEYVYGRKHGDYFDYDIAILVLEEPITFDNNPVRGLRPICLPKKGPYQNLVGEKVTVAGWGKTEADNDHSLSEELQMLEVPIIDLKKCSDVAQAKVTERNLCAGSLNRFKDAAGGDSGGPLMLKRDEQYTEVGIVSWGENVGIRGEVKTAALYSDVQQMVSFIDYHANRLQAKWCRSTRLQL